MDNYIKNGRGFGLLFLLASALLCTLMFSFVVRDAYNTYSPKIVEIANNFLPIEIQNGKIVSPEDFYKEVKIGAEENGDEYVFRVIMDTREGAEYHSEFKQGLFIYPNALYMVSDNQVKKMEYKHEGVLNTDDFSKFMDKFLSFFSVIMSAIVVVYFFIVFLLHASVVAIVGHFAIKIGGAELWKFSTLMRLSAFVVAFTEVLIFVLQQWVNWGVSGFNILIL